MQHAASIAIFVVIMASCVFYWLQQDQPAANERPAGTEGTNISMEVLRVISDSPAAWIDGGCGEYGGTKAESRLMSWLKEQVVPGVPRANHELS